MKTPQDALWAALKLQGDECVAAIHAAVQAGAGVNFHHPTMGEGETPLHMACVRERPVAIATLIALGANPYVLDAENRTPAIYALRNDCYVALRALMDAGVDLKIEVPGQFHTLLHMALDGGAYESVPVLLDAGIDPLSIDPNTGRSAVYLSTTYPSVIKELARRNIDLSGVNPNNSETLAHAVARTDIEESWLAVLESGTRLDIKSHSGQTALDLALEGNGPLRDLTLAWQSREAARSAISDLGMFSIKGRLR